MAYIRDRKSELTGYQNFSPYYGAIDIQCDFVMVYGLNETTKERIEGFKANGYVVHLMTGVAWGDYTKYLEGNWDGRKHWDEAQLDRNGKIVDHDHGTPYMVPTISYADYLTEIIKPAIDAGVDAVHLEEPEYWGFGGHAEAFKREYEFYYHKPWEFVEDSVNSIFKSSKVMAYLYTRVIDRVCASLKEYAKVKLQKDVCFYIPTHSLISYTQIHMVSPESLLLDIPSVDGYIAQIWTGTSRAPNEYQGTVKERTFEAGFLEYGIMQELVKGTNRRMWFLHDPVEDNPAFDWADYEYNYIKTVVASLFQPKVWHYEVCPWPSRVYSGLYPHNHKTIPPEPIPPHYATVLGNVFNMLGDMDQPDSQFIGNQEVGVLIADSAMYQRDLPDELKADPENANAVSLRMPDFFGLTMPLLKYGLPVRPLQLDNIKRYADYLNDYKVLLLSYEFFKPESPDINVSIVNWVAMGGILVYIGDGSDPFHQIDHWWNKDHKYQNAAEHLFESAGLGKTPKDGNYCYKEGFISVLNRRPALLAHTKQGAELIRATVESAMLKKQYQWNPSNHFMMERGPYLIIACMSESISASPVELDGLYADMTHPDLQVLSHIKVRPDENKVFFNLDKITETPNAIIGTTLRINEIQWNDGSTRFTCRGTENVQARIRLKVGYVPKTIKVSGIVGIIDSSFAFDKPSNTVLISFYNPGEELDVTIES